jgi:hypothetical protein
MPMNLEEAIEALNRMKYRLRIWGFVSDSLRPYLASDIGNEPMPISGCPIPNVPTEYIREVYEEMIDTLEEIDTQIKTLGSLTVLTEAELKKANKGEKVEK